MSPWREALLETRLLWMFSLALALAIVVGFSVCLAGDGLGLWEFDSGLGNEAGGSCPASEGRVPDHHPVEQGVSAWLRHKAEYGYSLGLSGVREAVERGDVAGALHALARIAERDEREADRA